MILEVKKVEKKYGRDELPNDLERTSEFEEVVLIEKTEQGAKREILTGFEDLLYEAWKEDFLKRCPKTGPGLLRLVMK